MCSVCAVHAFSRRGLGRAMAAACVAITGTARAAEADAPVEPRIKLANVPPDKRIVALTFDCCPGAFDLRIADVLITERIPATIFITWLWMRRNPEGLALLLAHPDLFAIENHGEMHLPPILGDRTIFGLRVAGTMVAIQREVANGASAIQAATGVKPRWYRAAAGFYSPSVIPAIEAMGFAIGGYTFSADLGASLPAARVTARMAAAKSGDVIVAHINQPSRPSGAGVVDGLRALQGQGTVSVRLDRVATTRAAYA